MEDRPAIETAPPEANDARPTGQPRLGESRRSAGVHRRPAGKRRPLPSEDELVAAARAAHERRPGPMTLEVFERLTGFKQWHVTGVMPGGWTELRERAAIPLHRQERNRRSNDELLAEFHRVASELGRVPRWSDIRRVGQVSQRPFQSRFGPKSELLWRYREWLEQHQPDSPFVAEIEAAQRRKGALPRPLSAGAPSPPGRTGRRTTAHPGGHGGIVCGEALNFRCVVYAPTNEKGVLVLFGAMAEDLGFRVHAVRPGFPDCEAMRALDAGRTQWQQVRIEFEHRSRNFRDHGHDPRGCDLVVCWKHDWDDCPLEVVELSAVVKERGLARGPC